MLPFALPLLPSLLLAFAGAMVVTWYFMPRIIKLAARHRLTDKPGPRKMHTHEIPTLGGIGIFGGFAFGFLISVNGYMDYVSYFTAALIILFFIGLKDDLITVAPPKKIAGQALSAFIIAAMANLRFTNFHGLFGIAEIPEWASLLTTVFFIVIFINAFNLIDGIDGLAASIGIISACAFGMWSWLSADYGYAFMAAALTGTLLVFLIFNLSNGKLKIFMGDTGSMVIGFLLAVMAIRFNEINAGTSTFYNLNSAPSVSIAILIVPLFDTLRVIVIRLARRQSLFKGDNRHIHHLMLRAGCTHIQATLYISLANIILIAVGFLLDKIGILWLGLVLLLLCTMLMIPVYLVVGDREGWDWKTNRWWAVSDHVAGGSYAGRDE
jgi:UDP-N-acetylmuramyl pentapeptide phosphotransferase/UDP-N-acetylglucosamine-1-phosphate transferase